MRGIPESKFKKKTGVTVLILHKTQYVEKSIERNKYMFIKGVLHQEYDSSEPLCTQIHIIELHHIYVNI